MADNPENLVSEVKISGADASITELNKLANEGGSAFDRLADAAKRAGSFITTSSKDISKALTGISDAAPDATVPTRLQNIVGAMSDLRVAAGNAITDVKGFVTSVAAVGAVGLGAVVGLSKFASKVTEAARGVNQANDDMVKGQQLANRQSVQTETSALNYGEALRKLKVQLQTGKIDYKQYGDAVKTLNDDFDAQRRIQDQLQAAQAEAQKKNQELARQAASNQAYQKLIDTYGGPLTRSLITLGDTYDQVKKQAIDAFSPALAGLVDKVGQVIDKNRALITKLIDEASRSLEDFITKEGPSFEQLINLITGLIRGIYDLIKNLLIPAFKTLMSAAGAFAIAINSVFGTDINASFVLMAAVLLKVSGGFSLISSSARLALGAVRLISAAFGPWGLIIAAVVIALTALYYAVDWTKLSTDAGKAATDIGTWFSALPGRILGYFANLWTSAGNLASAAVQFIIGNWTAVLIFFAGLPAQIGAYFTDLWTSVSGLASTAASAVIGAWQAVLSFFAALPETIVGYFANLWTNLLAAAQQAGQFVIDTWNAVVAFFQSLPATIGAAFTSVGDMIVAAFQSAVDRVKTFFSDLSTTVLGYLQPIIDTLKTIQSLAGSGPKIPGFAAGGMPSIGHVRGPGTSTSDSIMAWLSNNEFVMKAKAVGKYGLRFMHMINEGKLDIGKIAGYAAGGLVRAMQPMSPLRFADGGPVNSGASGMSTLNLSIGNESFNGLLMPDEVASKLTRYAVARHSSSAGRKPAWVGGKR